MTRPANTTPRRNRLIGLGLAGVVVGMVGMSFAAVPLYRLFCQVTGYGGTTQVAEKSDAQAPAAAGLPRVTVRFTADVNPALPWEFGPQQKHLSVRPGEDTMAFYAARNDSARAITGTATFNVTPLKAGQYFAKTECFCFTEQTLAPGERVDMPLSFRVDPAMFDDPNTKEIRTITLSYTFFPAAGADEARPRQARRGGADASENGG